nr:cytochrome P450 [Spodoptera frugiperda]
MSGLVVLASLVLVIFSLIYYLSTRNLSYWKKKNVPHDDPLPLLGNYGTYILQKEHPGIMIQKLCKKFKNEPYFGAYYGTEPALVVQDPEILKHVLTKDFYYTSGRESSKYSHGEVTTQNLFFSSGDRWKVIRQNLTPLFSSLKMKNMFYLIEKCAIGFEDMLDDEIKISNVIEARRTCSRYTMDCICSCAFGVESNTMAQKENNPFLLMADEIFESSRFRGFKIIFRAVWPSIFYRIGLQVFPSAINSFFFKLLTGIFESRGYKPSPRNDFVDQLLNLKKEDHITGECLSNVKTGGDKKIHLKVDDELLVAQCILFFSAGFETSANTMGFTLFELAKNPEVQQKAAEEVDEFMRRHNNKLVYDCVTELPYLEACMYEAMRMYPVLGILTREVMDDYVLPTGLKLDEGVRIHIPIYYMHYNPEFFPEPYKYNPERFMPGNKENINPNTYFAFGSGPRLCIGKRFSKMQVMSGLITFLKKYKVELADGMESELEFDPKTLLTQPLHNRIALKLTEREGWEQRRFVRS